MTPFKKRTGLTAEEEVERRKLERQIDAFYAQNENDSNEAGVPNFFPEKIQIAMKRLKHLEDVGGYTARRLAQAEELDARLQKIYAAAEDVLTDGRSIDAANEYLAKHGLPPQY